MFDFSWGELLIVGGVALVVIKPKDLPGVLRSVGQAVGKIRRMAGEFQGQFQEALREANLDEARKTISGLNDSVSSSLDTSFNPIQTIRDEIKSATEGKKDGAGSTPETPPVDLALPEPPPVPDLTPEQIQAAFATEPLGAAAPDVVEAAPEKPKRARKKAPEPAPTAEPAPAEVPPPAAASIAPVAVSKPAEPNFFEDMPVSPGSTPEPDPEPKPAKVRAPRKAAVRAKKAQSESAAVATSDIKSADEGGAA